MALQSLQMRIPGKTENNTLEMSQNKSFPHHFPISKQEHYKSIRKTKGWEMCGKTSKSVRISHKKRKAPPSTKQERSGKYAHSHIDKHVPRTHDVADRTILGPTQEGNRTLVDTSQSSSSSGQVAIRKRKIVDEEGEKEKEKEKGNPRIDVPEPTIKPKTADLLGCY